MSETFSYSFNAVMPMLLMMVLGYLVKRKGNWDTAFFKRLNKLCFSLFLPINLGINVYNISNLSSINWPAMLFLPVCVFLCSLIGLLASALFISERNQKGVIIQSSFRSNQSVLGLPLATALGIEGAVEFTSVAFAFCIPLFNILSIICLSYYSEKQESKVTVKSVLSGIVHNPLIIGITIAVLTVLIRQFIPTVNGVPVFSIKNNLPYVYTALSNLGKCASPLMIFILGATLDLGSTKSILKSLSVGIILRLIVSPLFVIALFLLLREPLHITKVVIPTLLAITATPVAVSSPVMTQEIGGDTQLASQLVVWSSLFSMFTIFSFIFVLRSMGIL